jgi:dihydroorotase
MPTVTIKNVKTLEGTVTTLQFEGPVDQVIEADGLTAMPALVDPHVHMRTPGGEFKEDFGTGAQAAIAGGVTTVFDMPNNEPPMTSFNRMEEKIRRIDQQLKRVDIPIRYSLFFGADGKNISEIQKAKRKIIGIKVFLGCSTGHLYVDDPKELERLFQFAAQEDIIIAVHAESQKIISDNQELYKYSSDVRNHSLIRSREAAIKATEQVIELAREYSTQVYFCHVSTKEELELLKDAKQDELLVYVEVTPQHLFLTDRDYDTLGTKAQMNPPLRTQEDHNALWLAIDEDWIDTIGTDHAPHTLQEKAKPYPESPSGMPGLETRLPLLLNAYNQGRISLNKIVELTRSNIDSIFRLPSQQDLVLVDLNLKKEVRDQDQKTKCGWSPFAGRILQGWPVYTIMKGRVYDLRS